MISVGLCTSSRSERHLMEALQKEIPNSELYEIYHPFLSETPHSIETDFDFLIIPADRSEMTKFAVELFHRNIPFVHFLAGSRSYSFTHDDINRQMISLMANFCFGESPEACRNLHEMGIPNDRMLLTGTSHFDGITMQDIEANKPKTDTIPSKNPHYYDLVLINPQTQQHPPNENINKISDMQYHIIKANEDSQNIDIGIELTHLEFLWMLHNAHCFISNSSAGHYELPYLQKFYGSKCKWINPSQRNKERTPIPPEYCRGASKIIADWCANVDLEWLKTPKRLFCKQS